MTARRARISRFPYLMIAADQLRGAKTLAEIAGDSVLAWDGTETKEQLDQISEHLNEMLSAASDQITQAVAAINTIYPGFADMVEQCDPPQEHGPEPEPPKPL